MYDKMISAQITAKIIRDIFLKYLCSFSVKGFSGVSSGQKIAIKIAVIAVIAKSGTRKSYDFESLITTTHENKDKVERIVHLVSVFAW